MVKCNLTPEEKAQVFGLFPECLSCEEEAQVQELLQPYVFYETFDTKNMRECHCTHCHTSYTVYKDEAPDFFKAHHNDISYCRECRAEVQLKALGRMRGYGYMSSLRHTDTIMVINKAPDGALLITAGIAIVNYHFDYLEPEIQYIQKKRYYIRRGKVQEWRRTVYTGVIKYLIGEAEPWHEAVNICKPFVNNPLYGWDDTYYLIGAENISASDLEYCQINEWWMAETGTEIFDYDRRFVKITEYLAEYAMHPQIEMCVKMGLPQVVTQRLDGNCNATDLNWRAKTPDKFFRLTKTETKEFMRDPDLILLNSYHKAKKEGVKCGIEKFRKILREYSAIGTERLAYCSAFCGVDILKAAQYVQSQKSGHNGNDRTVSFWKDYLDMAQRLNYDIDRTDVLMPKDLIARHDTAAATITALNLEEKNKLYAKRRKMLEKKYVFELDGLMISAPISGEEIIREGKTLEHCVGGYAERHLKGATTILFLRKCEAPDTPYVTIEMDSTGVKIRQIHGFRNEGVRGAVAPEQLHRYFLDVWLCWLKAGSPRDAKGNPVIKQEEKTA